MVVFIFGKSLLSMLSLIGMKNSYIQVFKAWIFQRGRAVLQLHQVTHLGCDIQIPQELQTGLY